MADVEYRDVTRCRFAPDERFQGLAKGTARTSGRLLFMNETLPSLIENSFQIAWDYLEATGELGNPDTAARHLLDTIETMIRRGERRRLLLSNRSIASYQRFRAERGMSLAC